MGYRPLLKLGPNIKRCPCVLACVAALPPPPPRPGQLRRLLCVLSTPQSYPRPHRKFLGIICRGELLWAVNYCVEREPSRKHYIFTCGATFPRPPHPAPAPPAGNLRRLFCVLSTNPFRGESVWTINNSVQAEPNRKHYQYVLTCVAAIPLSRPARPAPVPIS